MTVPAQEHDTPDHPLDGGPEENVLRRKIIDRELLALVKHTAEDIRAMRLANHEMQMSLMTHIAGEEQWRAKFLAAFPAGDLQAHRSEHESEARATALRDKLLTDIASKTVVGAVWALILLLGLALWEYVKRSVQT